MSQALSPQKRRPKRYEIQAAYLHDSISKGATEWRAVAYRRRESAARRRYWKLVNREYSINLVFRIYDRVKDEVIT